MYGKSSNRIPARAPLRQGGDDENLDGITTAGVDERHRDAVDTRFEGSVGDLVGLAGVTPPVTLLPCGGGAN